VVEGSLEAATIAIVGVQSVLGVKQTTAAFEAKIALAMSECSGSDRGGSSDKGRNRDNGSNNYRNDGSEVGVRSGANDSSGRGDSSFENS